MPNKAVPSRASAWILLIFIYYIAAASSFGGFFTKWHFRDQTTQISLPLALDGTEQKPFVYRQLLPLTANLLEGVIPQKMKVALLHKLVENPAVSNPVQHYYPGATDVTNARYSLRYLLVYAMTFLSLFGALFVMRAALIEVLGDRVAATLTPIVIAAVFPLILTQGGYYYDMPELLFMTLGVWLTLKRHLAALFVVVVLATLNKESYLLFVITLFPFATMRYSRGKSLLLIGVLVAVAAAVNVALKYRYMGNSGGMVEYQLIPHVLFLLNPLNYLRVEINYGVPTTRGFNIIHLLLVGILVKVGWRSLPSAVRTETLIGAIINVPLFIALCYKDELRDLSLLTMPFAFLISTTISAALTQTDCQTRESVVVPEESASAELASQP